MNARDTATAIIEKYHPLAHANGVEIEIIFGFGAVNLQVVGCERGTPSIAASRFAELFNVAVSSTAQGGALSSDDALSARAQGNSVIVKSKTLGKVTLDVVHSHSSSLRRIALLGALAIVLAGRLNETPK